MFADIPFAPEQASTVAGRVDALFAYLNAVTAFFTLLIAGLIIAFAVKYRRRSDDEIPPPLKGSFRLEVAWSVGPFILAMTMFYWGASVYLTMARPPDDALDVYVVGRQWMWKLQHEGGQREINTLHVPVGRPVRLLMTSEDVIHSFFVPAFRIKQDVLPGRYVHAWFEATKTGTYHLFCAEYCGTGHSDMIGRVVVLEPAEYEAWLSEHAEGSLALEGRKLFQKLQCVACHSGTAQARGPVLEGVYRRRVPLQDGSPVLADEAYLLESILHPEQKVVAGYRPIMPSYRGRVSEEELFRLVVYLKSLQPGQTPPRVEESAPPTLQEPPRP